MKTLFPLIAFAALAAGQLRAGDTTSTAATAINALGIDLLAKTGKPGENALLSPYSIQNALAMTYAGAAGGTRDEMAKALHFPKDGAELNKSFAALQAELAAIAARTKATVAQSKKDEGEVKEPITFSVANRLYGQEGYDFRKPYLALLKESYGAPLEQVDFKKAPGHAANLINAWVEEQTHKRIRDLVPDGALNSDSRLVLVNAIYFKAAWQDEFEDNSTRPASFHVNGGGAKKVPTMIQETQYGYAKKEGYTAVALPYIGSDLQLLVLLPDKANGLAALEAKLTPGMLAGCAKLDPTDVVLWLPKFKIEPPAMELSGELQALGMKTAFDDPAGSANFDGIAPRTRGDYLYISEVFHKTFLSLDEHGTEAAAATVVMMPVGAAAPGGPPPPKPKEVHVDHPFIFAIQDCNSGACLFLGCVNDPR